MERRCALRVQRPPLNTTVVTWESKYDRQKPGEGRDVAQLLAVAALPRPGLANTIDNNELMMAPGNPVECYLVAYEDLKMVGAVGASPPWNWLTELGKHGLAREEQRRIGMIIAKIVSVVVEPDHRRQGVGRKLFAPHNRLLSPASLQMDVRAV